MGEYPDFSKPDRDDWDDDDFDGTAPAQPLISLQAQQDIAHDRGRICKKRGCVVCAPLVEKRKLRKKERKAENQALAHSKGKPCGRASCELPVCVEALKAAAAAPPPVEPPSAKKPVVDDQTDDPQADLDLLIHRQGEKHRIGLACGLEDCKLTDCVVGFTNERKRRHRSNRPCRAARCDNPICVAGRPKR